MKKTSLILSLALCAAFPFAANAADAACAPVLKDGWVRLPAMANAPMAAGFGTLENPCKADAEIIAVQSPRFAGASMHQSMVMDGMAMMHELSALQIPAGKSVELKPGSYHLMLMKPSAPLVDGEKIAVSFKLKDGRDVVGELTVKKPQ